MKVLFCALCMNMMSMLATATAVSAKTEMFPALRKRKQQQIAAAQQETENLQAPGPVEEDAMGPVQAGASPVVPSAVDMGSDGFPQLPAVSQMLSGASGTLKTVSTQASSLQARVVQAQMQSESKMAKQKAAFEEKLKQQEEKNRLVILANSNISSEISGLTQSNADLRKQAHEIEQNNHVMRLELHELQARLGVAKDFTAKSLTSTDDRKNALLQVLHHNKDARVVAKISSKAQKDDDDEDDDSDDDQSDQNSTSADADSSDDEDDEDDASDAPATSFLSLSTKVRRIAKSSNFVSSLVPDVSMSDLETSIPAVPASNTGDLLGDLMKDVAHLADQEKQSVKTLKTLFIADFRAGAKRKAALLAQQKQLTATRASLVALQSKLKIAVAHLEATHSHLQGRLHGIGHFLQKLAHLAMAPQQDVAKLTEGLPKAVTVDKTVL